MRRAANVDTVQPEIVKALRQIGASVAVTSTVGAGFPDLTVGYRGQTFLLEVKTGADKLNQIQKDWHSKWAGHIAIVRTAEEAQLAIIHGVMK
jgi:tRNA U38,U39,U40 pseudouridine synthase TruA